MLLCYGIVKSLIGLLYAWMPDYYYAMAGILAMLASYAASLLLTGVCYYIVYRYFSRDVLYPEDAAHPFYTASEMQQMSLVFIPILMIFIMSEYINTLAFDYRYVVLEEDGSFEYLLSQWQLLAMHLLGLLSLFCILFSYKKLQQNFRLSTEISLLEQEEHSLNRLYRVGQDENGNRKILFDDPKAAHKKSVHAEEEKGLKPEEGGSREGEDGKGPKVSGDSQGEPAEKCVANTDKVDREIKKLKEEKKQLEQQIQSASGDEKKIRELEKKLAQVENELRQKDNDTYRRQNASVIRI